MPPRANPNSSPEETGGTGRREGGTVSPVSPLSPPQLGPGACSHGKHAQVPHTGQDHGRHGDPAMEVHGGIKGHVAVEEGLSQEGDEVAAHGEQDVGEHEGDTGRRAPRQDDAHKGGLCNARGWRGKGVVWG